MFLDSRRQYKRFRPSVSGLVWIQSALSLFKNAILICYLVPLFRFVAQCINQLPHHVHPKIVCCQASSSLRDAPNVRAEFIYYERN